MRILLTGFNPFGSNAVNPSQIIVQTLGERTYDAFDLITVVLRTEFAAAGDALAALIRDIEPDAVVMLGLAGGRATISLERVAINLNDASIPDNAGDHAQGRLIVEDAPVAYWSTLPLAEMLDALQARAIPASYSNHAGAFVCNHVFYTARHAIEQAELGIPCGFIHLPHIAETAEANGLPLATLLDGIETCLAVISRAHDSF